jgi:hypothetical protein
MASNNGARLAVFGLTYRQHDNRQMQQILRAYGRLPSNPGSRADLFLGLFDLSKDLGDGEVQGIDDWLQKGGVPDDFPALKPPSPSPVPTDDMEVDGDEILTALHGGEEEWQEYNPADFETGDTEVAVAYPAGESEMDFEPQHEMPDDDEPAELLDDEHLRNGVDFADPWQGQDEPRDFDDDLNDWGNTDNGAEGPENECSICMGVMDSADELVPTKVTAKCDHDHKHRTCFCCLEQQLTVSVKGGSLSHLNCPFCPEKFSAEEVKRYATPETFAR